VRFFSNIKKGIRKTEDQIKEALRLLAKDPKIDKQLWLQKEGGRTWIESSLPISGLKIWN
jgi:hypothetical protein